MVMTANRRPRRHNLGVRTMKTSDLGQVGYDDNGNYLATVGGVDVQFPPYVGGDPLPEGACEICGASSSERRSRYILWSYADGPGGGGTSVCTECLEAALHP